MKNLFKCGLAFAFLFASHILQAQCLKGSLLSIRATKVGVYNYVTFTFKGKAVPNLTIQNANPPFTHSTSGDPVSVSGCKFKNVRFRGATYCHVARYLVNLPYNSVKAVKSLDQFEGYYEYAIGYRCGGAYLGKTKLTAGLNWGWRLKFK